MAALQPDVAAGFLRQEPLVLEHVAVGLDQVADGPTAARSRSRVGSIDVGQPALGALGPIDRALLEPLEPGPIFAQVVDEHASLALEGPDPGQSLELVDVEPAGGDRDPQPERAGAGRRARARSRRPRSRGR